MAAPSFRTHPHGPRQVFRPDDYVKREEAAGREQVARQLATCGTCRKTWDDGHATGCTPAPAARCPFESTHR